MATATIPDCNESGGELLDRVELRAPSQQIKALFSAVVHCADRESTRYALNCVELSATGRRLTAAATDGRRLAMRSIECLADPVNVPVRVLIPAGVAEKVADMGSTATGMVSIVIFVASGAGSVSWRQRNGDRSHEWEPVAGRFPDWGKIADSAARPDNASGVMDGKARDILESLPDRDPVWILDLESATWRAEGVAINPGQRSKINLSGDCETGINPEFLRDWLRTLDDTEHVTICLDPNGPCSGFIGKERRFVFMPLTKGGRK